MLGFGAIGEFAIGEAGDQANFVGHIGVIPLSVSSIIIADAKTSEGTLIKSTSAIWREIVRQIGSDWSLAYQIPPEKWEEIIAGAFKEDGFDEVTLTSRSGDHGRDVIAIRRGVGCIKILGSVKAYGPGKIVPYDAVRSLLGVMSAERNTSKGMITTTSDFPKNIETDPFIAPFLPTRLELLNGRKLQAWLTELAKGKQA